MACVRDLEPWRTGLGWKESARGARSWRVHHAAEKYSDLTSIARSMLKGVFDRTFLQTGAFEHLSFCLQISCR